MKKFLSLLMIAFLFCFSGNAVFADEEEFYEVESGNSFYSGKYLDLFLSNHVDAPNVLQDEKYRKKITREEFAELIVAFYCKLNNINKENINLHENTFVDTDHIDIRIANSLGLFFGETKDRFNPGGRLTREQFATICYRFLQVQKPDIKNVNSNKIEKFCDKSGISEWALDSLRYMVDKDYIKGALKNAVEEPNKYSIMPKEEISIQDTITILGRVAEAESWLQAKNIYYCGFYLPPDTAIKGYGDCTMDNVEFALFTEGADKEKMTEDMIYAIQRKFTDIDKSNLESIKKIISDARLLPNHLARGEHHRVDRHILVDDFDIHIKGNGDRVFVFIRRSVQ